MSSLKLVQRALEPSLAETAESGGSKQKTEQLAETGGLVFSDGSCLELIPKDHAGQLTLLHSSRKRGAQRIKYQRRTYVPPIIHASLSEALTLPHGRVSSSTTDLFMKLCAVFTERGFSDETGKKLAYWTLSTWFVELLPLAPCLLMTGSRPEATLLCSSSIVWYVTAYHLQISVCQDFDISAYPPPSYIIDQPFKSGYVEGTICVELSSGVCS